MIVKMSEGEENTHQPPNPNNGRNNRKFHHALSRMLLREGATSVGGNLLIKECTITKECLKEALDKYKLKIRERKQAEQQQQDSVNEGSVNTDRITPPLSNAPSPTDEGRISVETIPVSAEGRSSAQPPESPDSETLNGSVSDGNEDEGQVSRLEGSVLNTDEVSIGKKGVGHADGGLVSGEVGDHHQESKNQEPREKSAAPNLPPNEDESSESSDEDNDGLDNLQDTDDINSPDQFDNDIAFVTATILSPNRSEDLPQSEETLVPPLNELAIGPQGPASLPETVPDATEPRDVGSLVTVANAGLSSHNGPTENEATSGESVETDHENNEGNTQVEATSRKRVADKDAIETTSAKRNRTETGTSSVFREESTSIVSHSIGTVEALQEPSTESLRQATAAVPQNIAGPTEDDCEPTVPVSSVSVPSTSTAPHLVSTPPGMSGGNIERLSSSSFVQSSLAVEESQPVRAACANQLSNEDITVVGVGGCSIIDLMNSHLARVKEELRDELMQEIRRDSRLHVDSSESNISNRSPSLTVQQSQINQTQEGNSIMGPAEEPDATLSGRERENREAITEDSHAEKDTASAGADNYPVLSIPETGESNAQTAIVVTSASALCSSSAPSVNSATQSQSSGLIASNSKNTTDCSATSALSSLSMPSLSADDILATIITSSTAILNDTSSSAGNASTVHNSAEGQNLVSESSSDTVAPTTTSNTTQADGNETDDDELPPTITIRTDIFGDDDMDSQETDVRNETSTIQQTVPPVPSVSESVSPTNIIESALLRAAVPLESSSPDVVINVSPTVPSRTESSPIPGRISFPSGTSNIPIHPSGTFHPPATSSAQMLSRVPSPRVPTGAPSIPVISEAPAISGTLNAAASSGVSNITARVGVTNAAASENAPVSVTPGQPTTSQGESSAEKVSASAESEVMGDLDRTIAHILKQAEDNVRFLKNLAVSSKAADADIAKKYSVVTASIEKTFKLFETLDASKIALKMKHRCLPSEPNGARSAITNTELAIEELADYFEVMLEATLLSRQPNITEKMRGVLVVLITRVVRLLGYFMIEKRSSQESEALFQNMNALIMTKERLVSKFQQSNLSFHLTTFWGCIRGSTRGSSYRQGAILDHANMGPQKFMERIQKFQVSYNRTRASSQQAPPPQAAANIPGCSTDPHYIQQQQASLQAQRQLQEELQQQQQQQRQASMRQMQQHAPGMPQQVRPQTSFPSPLPSQNQSQQTQQQVYITSQVQGRPAPQQRRTPPTMTEHQLYVAQQQQRQQQANMQQQQQRQQQTNIQQQQRLQHTNMQQQQPYNLAQQQAYAIQQQAGRQRAQLLPGYPQPQVEGYNIPQRQASLQVQQRQPNIVMRQQMQQSNSHGPRAQQNNLRAPSQQQANTFQVQQGQRMFCPSSSMQAPPQPNEHIRKQTFQQQQPHPHQHISPPPVRPQIVQHLTRMSQTPQNQNQALSSHQQQFTQSIPLQQRAAGHQLQSSAQGAVSQQQQIVHQYPTTVSSESIISQDDDCLILEHIPTSRAIPVARIQPESIVASFNGQVIGQAEYRLPTAASSTACNITPNSAARRSSNESALSLSQLLQNTPAANRTVSPQQQQRQQEAANRGGSVSVPLNNQNLSGGSQNSALRVSNVTPMVTQQQFGQHQQPARPEVEINHQNSTQYSHQQVIHDQQGPFLVPSANSSQIRITPTQRILLRREATNQPGVANYRGNDNFQPVITAVSSQAVTGGQGVTQRVAAAPTTSSSNSTASTSRIPADINLAQAQANTVYYPDSDGNALTQSRVRNQFQNQR